jgi:membrane fusion protein (multidrug efflux system)
MSASATDRTVDEPLPPGARSSAGRQRGRQRGRRRAAFALLGLLPLAGAGWYADHWWSVGRFVETTDDAYVGGNVTPIAPHVAGFVQSILAGDNQFVRAGQVLVRLDPADYRAALEHAQAVLAERQATLAQLEASETVLQATVRQAEADLAAKRAAAVFAAEEASRYTSLARTAAGSRQAEQKAAAGTQMANAASIAAEAALAAARQQLVVLGTRIAGAKAAIVQAEADVHTADLRLGYTEIRAPIDGYVGDRYAQAGAYVAAGTNLLSIVPAHGLWVDANFKEDEIARMKPGDPATIVADVASGQALHGHVASLAPATGAVFSVIPPQNATGNFTKIVQRVPVRILLDGEAGTLGTLRPGLSTTVSVNTDRRNRPPS